LVPLISSSIAIFDAFPPLRILEDPKVDVMKKQNRNGDLEVESETGSCEQTSVTYHPLCGGSHCRQPEDGGPLVW
jgi:hypothetical protein